MTISDEQLMAYADGELEGAQFAGERSALEAEIARDPELARRLAQHRQLRQQLSGLHASALEEPVPERLLAAVRGRASATVTDLNAVRAARAAARQPAQRAPMWRALAASVFVIAGIGYLAYQQRTHNPIGVQNGMQVAQAALATALDEQPSGTAPAGAAAQMGVSFRTKDGAYCRTFVLNRAQPLAGLACHEAQRWQLKALAPASTSAGGTDNYRLATSALPDAVRGKVESLIDGEPLDAAGEAQARAAHWQ